VHPASFRIGRIEGSLDVLQQQSDGFEARSERAA
jgi:hypothetical protein